MNKEREKKDASEEVTRLPEEISEEVERVDGIARTVSTFSKTVTDDSGQALVHDDSTKPVSIVVPAGDDDIEEGSRGDVQDSSVWFFRVLKRLLKKAVHFNWKIERKENA